jgi:hypothetical protein
MSLKKIVFLAVLAILVIVFGLFGAQFFSASDTLKDTLAEQFNVSPEALYVNLPPATGRYPGAVFIRGDRLFPVEFANGTDERLQRGVASQLNLKLDASAVTAGGLDLGYFEQLSEGGRTESMTVELLDVVPVEMRIGDIKALLLASEDAKAAAQRNQQVYVVSKAYEGRMDVILEASDNESASAIARGIAIAMPGAKASVEGSVNKNRQVRVSFSEPTVFAFEVVEASFFSTSLSVELSDVQVSPVRTDMLPEAAFSLNNTAGDKKASEPQPNWGVITFASGIYPNQSVWDQPWNRASAETVQRELAHFNPTFAIEVHAERTAPLTRARALNAIQTFAKDSSELDVIIAYYIGHMLVRDDGEIVLLTSEGRSDSIHNDPMSTLSLRKLYEALEQLEKPFVLLVDGCLASDEVDSFRKSLGFQLPQGHGQMHYIGSAGLITNELNQYQSFLDQFASQHQYMHTSNPVILAAKPGTIAPGVLDPRNAWGPLHGPLAGRIVRMIDRIKMTGSNRPLVEIIQGTVDFNGVGQLTSEGTISWSEFGEFRHVGLREKNSPVAVLLNEVAFEGISRLAPLSDGSGYWVQDFNGDTWRWSQSTGHRENVANEEPFTSIVSVANSDNRIVYDGWTHSVTLANENGTTLKTLIDGISVGAIKGYPSETAWIVEDNGDIGTRDGVFRVQGQTISRVFEVEGSDVFDIADTRDGGVVVSIPEKGQIIKLAPGREAIFATGLIQPTQLAMTDDYLYAISGDGLIVYRIDDERCASHMVVNDYLSIKNISHHPRRAFTITNGDQLVFGIDGKILRIDSADVSWISSC